MGSRAKRNRWSNAVVNLSDQARGAADAGDRWFVSLGTGLEDIFVLARSEANDVSEAVSSALRSTVRFTKQIAGRGTRPREKDSEPFARFDGLSPDGPRSTDSRNLDLLPATDSLDEPHTTASGHPSGLLPVLQALERIVREHARTRQASLAKDPRFWSLIELLNLLRPRKDWSDATEV